MSNHKFCFCTEPSLNQFGLMDFSCGGTQKKPNTNKIHFFQNNS